MNQKTFVRVFPPSVVLYMPISSYDLIWSKAKEVFSHIMLSKTVGHTTKDKVVIVVVVKCCQVTSDLSQSS